MRLSYAPLLICHKKALPDEQHDDPKSNQEYASDEDGRKFNPNEVTA